MAHHITAVIGSPNVIARIAEVAGCPQPTELPFGLVAAPFGREQIDKLTALAPGAYLGGFNYLSEGLQIGLIAAAGNGAFAYVETEYFGGAGSQAAALFDQSRMVLSAWEGEDERASPDSPINTVLRALGVEARKPKDEFDALGLGAFRSNDDLGLRYE